MTFTEAAQEVLRLAGKPLHFKDITQMAIEKNLLSHVGKTPDVTMGARLSLQLKKDPDGPLVRMKPGIFGLREWETGTGKKKKKGSADHAKEEAKEPATTEAAADQNDDDDDATADQFAALASSVDAAEHASSREARNHRDHREQPAALGDGSPGEDEDAAPLDEDERMRGQLAASATDLFEEEDDDDQPLFGGPEPAPASGGVAGAVPEAGRRRRRRRRRGKGRDDGAPGIGNPAAGFAGPGGAARMGDDDDEEETIGVTIGDEGDAQPMRRAIVLERVPAAPQHGGGNRGRQQEFRPPQFQRSDRMDGRPEGREGRDNREGRDGRDRDRDRMEGRGPRQQEGNFDLSQANALDSIEQLDELAGRELSDVVFAIVSASDRLQGPVPLRAIADAAFRRGKLSGDQTTAVSAIAAAVRGDNLRRAAAGQRARFRFAQGGRISPTDWVLGPELLRLEAEAQSAIERYRDAARRTLASKLQKDMSGPALVELLLLALERLGFRDIRPVRRAGLPGGESHFSGVHATQGVEIRTAIVLRRDGREIGRERVIDLRGSLHHYGPASAGWLITTGQCLSGAREEASAPGTTPIALFDSIGFARLLGENDVAVVKTRIELPFPDVELLETLRGI